VRFALGEAGPRDIGLVHILFAGREVRVPPSGAWTSGRAFTSLTWASVTATSVMKLGSPLGFRGFAHLGHIALPALATFLAITGFGFVGTLEEAVSFPGGFGAPDTSRRAFDSKVLRHTVHKVCTSMRACTPCGA